MSTIFQNKKYENKNLKNLNKSISKINSLVHLEDNKYVNKEYNDLIKYYGKLVKKDKCVTIFTNEVALYYF